LGSNKASETTVKLFPRDGQEFVDRLQARLKELTGKKLEAMIYGDGAFKDPVSGIWELADPVVSPAYTKGLEGTPNEVKLKYLADNVDDKENLDEKIKEIIRSKEKNLVGQMISQGTTPRRLTDLLGSLCDLASGSGDKGTPVVLIQGYFDNYAVDAEQ
jgi:F420-0:gamma-glutamyl ligase